MKVSCPTCERPVEWTSDNPLRPFCSERCKLIDLGGWADERHRIPDTTAGIPPGFDSSDPPFSDDPDTPYTPNPSSDIEPGLPALLAALRAAGKQH